MQRVAVSGASGMIGARLCERLASRGVDVARLVRRPARGPDEIAWEPGANTIDADALAGIDAVVHLAGENVGGGRWNEARKRRILESRERGTRLLAEALAGLARPPRVLVSASAIGFYGDSGDPPVDEQSPAGGGFLARVVRAWEEAAAPARAAGIRVVHPRMGIVLSASGGVLGRLLLPFRLGLGGVVGGGRQPMSWIALADCLAALDHLLGASDLDGPVNLVAPEPVTNAEFTRVLARVLHRPARLPLPAVLVELALGAMGRELLLAGQRVDCARLEASGFAFRYPDLESALRAELA